MASVDLEFLRQEYFRLQETVETFDERALTVKSWSITLGMSGIGAAFLEELPILLVLSGLATLLFWLTETLWKLFQQAYYPRIKQIEEAMRTGSLDGFSSPAIATAWSIAWHASRRPGAFLRVMFWPHVALPHVIVTIAGIALWFVNKR